MKHATLLSKPVSLVSSFDESSLLSDVNINMTEQHLVRVWSGARSKPNSKTFDELRLEVQKKSIHTLSRVIHGHLKRAFYVTRNALTFPVPEPNVLDPLSNGWFNQDGPLWPLKYLKAIPSNFLSICGCSVKCNSERCTCKTTDVKCVIYYHKKVTRPSCIND